MANASISQGTPRRAKQAPGVQPDTGSPICGYSMVTQ
jgi:hypothetical protein